MDASFSSSDTLSCEAINQKQAAEQEQEVRQYSSWAVADATIRQ
jgi:hypothetical protein